MSRSQGKIDTDGAIINVQVGLGAAEAAFLRATGRTLPAPFPTTALLDTGASRTAIDPMILNHLGASSRGFASVGVPGQANTIVRLYKVQITLGSHRPAFEVRAVGASPATHTVAVLIGRDILEHGALFYDSQNKVFSLWF